LTQQTILIYTPKINNRLRYIFKLILTELLGLKFTITDDSREFIKSTQAKFSYAFHPIGDELFICAKQLLFESGLKDQEIQVTQYNDIPVFFATSRFSAIPFDPFAASFYMVSRYEEYLPTIYDTHQRFEAHHCLAYNNGFLQKPVVNLWAYTLRDLLKSKFPTLQILKREYKYVSTIDIDNAWAFKQKGLIRTLGGYLKSLSLLDFKAIGQRTKVLLGFERDPYDTYAFQLEIQKKYNLKTLYFILFASYGKNDKNVPITSRKFCELIKSISDNAEIGIHPSYGSNYSQDRLPKEINRLSKVLNREITKSRQHFLKLSFPETYHHLLELGITDDYTMGFASEIGFRAGICDSFNFYDLDLETETKLRIHPFQVMDASLRYYMKVDVDEAILKIKPIVEEIKKVDGTFMSLWHNESLSNVSPWDGWRNVYEQTVMEASVASENK
jgi:hypothetical protein